jgi:hypothetical protein
VSTHRTLTICHAEVAWGSVLHFEVFIIKFASVDALATDAGAVSEVSALDHEVGNHAVEFASFVVKRFV